MVHSWNRKLFIIKNNKVDLNALLAHKIMLNEIWSMCRKFLMKKRNISLSLTHLCPHNNRGHSPLPLTAAPWPRPEASFSLGMCRDETKASKSSLHHILRWKTWRNLSAVNLGQIKEGDFIFAQKQILEYVFSLMKGIEEWGRPFKAWYRRLKP